MFEASSAASSSADERRFQPSENRVAPRWLGAAIAARDGRTGAPTARTRSRERGLKSTRRRSAGARPDTWSTSVPPLPLEPGQGDAAHEVLLGDHEEDDHREQADEGAGHHLGPLADELALEERQADGCRVGGQVAQVDQGIEQVVPAPHELEDREGREGGPGEWDVDAQEDLPRVGPIDAGRVGQLARDRQEELAQKESPEGSPEERPHPERGRFVPIQLPLWLNGQGRYR